MIYNDFQEKKISALGYGGMRLPQKDSKGCGIDEAEAARLLEYAYNNGVNYFDSAFFYHAGNSELVMGKVLSQFKRDTWYFADKMPGNFIELVDGKIAMDLAGMGMENMTFDTPRDVFEYQLKKVGVEYFDFYMLHNVSEITYDLYTNDDLGMVQYLLDEKKAGRIGHVGISTHGRPETVEKFLTKYEGCFEFALMQLNYLDWTLQEAGKKYDIITKHGIPIFVMEPVRGGKLAAPGKDAEALLKAARPDDTPAKWAFRFLQSLPNIKVILSGMSSMAQLEENIKISSQKEPLTDAEKKVLEQSVEAMATFVPCTACRYCCDACPQKLNIPMLISTYNEAVNDLGWWYISDILASLADSEKPGACIACGACRTHCPQNIDIAEVMSKFDALIKSKGKS